MTRPSARPELARLIEQTSRGADLTRAQLEAACADARANGFGSVCVNGSRIIEAVHWLDDSEVKVTCAVGFPLGAADADVKRYETEVAIDSGAHFIEVSASLGRVKDDDEAALLRELRDVVEAADERPVSVFLNTDLLTAEEIRRTVRQAVNAAAKGIALPGGLDSASTLEAVKLIRETAAEGFGIKVDLDRASLDEVITLLHAGVTRFGLPQGAILLENLP